MARYYVAKGRCHPLCVWRVIVERWQSSTKLPEISTNSRPFLIYACVFRNLCNDQMADTVLHSSTGTKNMHGWLSQPSAIGQRSLYAIVS